MCASDDLFPSHYFFVRLFTSQTPLQLKNSLADSIHPSTKPKPKPSQALPVVFEILVIDKENNLIASVIMILATEPSLELSAIKKKLERIRVNKERTEKKLNEKHAMLDLKIEQHGEIHKK
ncbi:hypothetical protein E2542_SST26503 [Spatholobus suberectus]|nr:hypothetical protein E2542_SST26503 [Spatholobus suberectus]